LGLDLMGTPLKNNNFEGQIEFISLTTAKFDKITEPAEGNSNYTGDFVIITFVVNEDAEIDAITMFSLEDVEAWAMVGTMQDSDVVRINSDVVIICGDNIYPQTKSWWNVRFSVEATEGGKIIKGEGDHHCDNNNPTVSVEAEPDDGYRFVGWYYESWKNYIYWHFFVFQVSPIGGESWVNLVES